MNTTNTVLLVVNLDKTYNMFINSLEKTGINVITSNGFEKSIKDCISAYLPDILLIDYDIMTIDVRVIIKYFKQMYNKDKKLIFIGTSILEQEKLKMRELGVDLIIEKPFNFSYMHKKILDVLGYKSYLDHEEYTTIKEYNKEYFIELARFEVYKMGINKSTNAWEKLYKTIAKTVENKSNVHNLKHNIYKDVSDEYNITQAALESTIRRCINSIWNNGNKRYLVEYFSLISDSDWDVKKPVTKVFLKTVSDNIIKHMTNSKRFLEISTLKDKK